MVGTIFIYFTMHGLFSPITSMKNEPISFIVYGVSNEMVKIIKYG